MKNLLFVLLYSILISCAAPAKAPKNIPAKTATVVWGQTNISGLQMGTEPNKLPVVLVTLRNNGKNSLHYNCCFLGTDEGISVSARLKGTTTWRVIAFDDERIMYREGIGPTAYAVQLLSPGASIPPESFLQFKSRVNDKKLSIKMRKNVPRGTFVVNLENYGFPATWSGKSVEVRLSQVFVSDEERPSWQGMISSGALAVQLPASAMHKK